MEFESQIHDMLMKRLNDIAQEIKTTIEYEFSVEYGKVDIGEPTVTEEMITFDLNNLSEYEKELLETIYYENAKKRRAKGGG